MSEREPEKWAVLIGVEYYDHPTQPRKTRRLNGRGEEIEFKTLRGCINDVVSMERYLLDNIDIRPGNITKLLAPSPGRTYSLPLGSYIEPTYDNIIDTFIQLPRKAAKGDFVYIHFSGHGSRTTTIFPDLKDGGADAEDEALVPSDITRGGKYLRDLELGALLQDMVKAGLILTVVLDCCHSGGAVRGDDDDDDCDADADGDGGDPSGGQTRGIPGIYVSDRAIDTPRMAARISYWGRRPSWLRDPRDFVVLAACLENEKANETTTDPRHGVLTYWLLRALGDNPADVSSQALYEQLRDNVRYDSSKRVVQTPYFIGDPERFFFSKKIRSQPRISYLRVCQGIDLRMEMKDRRVILNGGTLQGVQVDSEYAILRYGSDLSKRIGNTEIIGRIKVVRVLEGECLARFVPYRGTSWAEIREGCPAILRKLAARKKSKVCLVGADDATRTDFLQTWKKCHGDQIWLELVDTDRHDFSVSIGKGQNFEIRDSFDMYNPAMESQLAQLPAADMASSVPKLIRRLEHLARFKMTRELVGLGMEKSSPAASVSCTIDPPQSEGGMWEMNERTAANLKFQNTSDRELSIVVLCCSPELEIRRLFPTRSPHKTLKPSQPPDRVEIRPGVADELRPLSTAGGYLVEVYKVFVCEQPRTLDALAIPSLKNLEDANTRDSSGEDRLPEDLDGLLEELESSRYTSTGSSSETPGLKWGVNDLQLRVIPQERALRCSEGYYHSDYGSEGEEESEREDY